MRQPHALHLNTARLSANSQFRGHEVTGLLKREPTRLTWAAMPWPTGPAIAFQRHPVSIRRRQYALRGHRHAAEAGVSLAAGKHHDGKVLAGVSPKAAPDSSAVTDEQFAGHAPPDEGSLELHHQLHRWPAWTWTNTDASARWCWRTRGRWPCSTRTPA